MSHAADSDPGDPSRFGPLVAAGRAIGRGAVTGRARFVANASAFKSFRAGEILLADEVAADWPDALGGAAAIVVNRIDCPLAAAAAERLGIPAVIGAVDGAAPIWTGAMLTVCCDGEGGGLVYERAAGAT